jgi:hypothetical protein
LSAHLTEYQTLLARIEKHERVERTTLLDAVERCIKAIPQAREPGVKNQLRSKATELMNKAESLKPGAYKSMAPKESVSSRKAQKEPQSTRSLSNGEIRLILLASKSYGMKFPPWTRTPNDNDFALNQSPPGSSTDELFLDSVLSLCQVQEESFQEWLRSTSAIPPPTWFGEAGLPPIMKADCPTDLVQDAVPDCSVVASMCVEQSRMERGFPTVRCLLMMPLLTRKLLSKIMFPHDASSGSPRFSPNGRYIFKFNFNGCWRMVDIDDRLPVSKSHRVLHVVDRNNPNLIWPALLEKAYLKLRGGYDFRGSNSSTDIWVIYGWIPEQIYLHQ